MRPAVVELDRQRAKNDFGLTFFEITTAMALAHFDREDVEIAVLEVGMGGRLDSTNVCEPLISVITNISLDHTRQLGNTLESIATEKAGIIKPRVPVVSGVVPAEPRQVSCADSSEPGTPRSGRGSPSTPVGTAASTASAGKASSPTADVRSPGSEIPIHEV